MAVRWYMQFRSLRSNTLYEVNVYDDGYTGTPVELTGAADVFVTDEDSSDDMFLSVRTQTGYLSIVDYVPGFDWTLLIPETSVSRPVTLTTGSSVLWSGFLQPKTFTGALYGNPQERRFPLCCSLSVLDSFDVEPGVCDVSNFAFLLHYIFSKVPGLPFTFVFGGGRGVASWLQKRVNWEVLRDYDSDNIARSRYTCLELLQEICTFWGWS